MFPHCRRTRERLLFALVAGVALSGCAGAKGPRESITIDSVPQGARVHVAGREIGVTPLTVKLDETFPRQWTRRATPDEEAFAYYRRMETVDLKKDGCETYTKIYIEPELQDDIKVALKCDPNYKPPVAAPAAKPETVEQRLRTLEELKSKGLVTDEEYRAQRQRILNSM
jgi:hypothetical protein